MKMETEGYVFGLCLRRTMTELSHIRARYLDASAAVKLVVSERGSDVVQTYIGGGGPFYITSVCVQEVLSVLKTMHLYRKQLSQDQYLLAAYGFLAHLRNVIHVENVGLENQHTFFEVENLAKQYQLDLVDALQIYTLKHGQFSKLAGPSKSLLITADGELGKAAKQEGFDVWDCLHEPMPRQG